MRFPKRHLWSIGSLILLLAVCSAQAQQIRYVYDDLGRLIAVIDQQGNAAVYEYDAVGNILAIRRTDVTGPVAITFLTPERGTIGTEVRIFGIGFSDIPNQNTIDFNGVPSAVLAASLNSLTTQVPNGATTGPITVTTPLGTAVSPTPFTVVSCLNLSNAGFEDDPSSLVDWSVVDQTGSNGSWFVQMGTFSPVSRLAVPAPPEGLQAAMTDQGGPGSHILFRDIALPPAAMVLSFDLFLGNRAGAWSVPPSGSLDYTVIPNQHVRVDIMDPMAPVDDVGAGVLTNLFIPAPGDPPVSGYQTLTADLSAFAGRTVRLRFAEVDNQNALQMGVDNIQVCSGGP